MNCRFRLPLQVVNSIAVVRVFLIQHLDHPRSFAIGIKVFRFLPASKQATHTKTNMGGNVTFSSGMHGLQGQYIAILYNPPLYRTLRFVNFGATQTSIFSPSFEKSRVSVPHPLKKVGLGLQHEKIPSVPRSQQLAAEREGTEGIGEVH